MQNPRRPVLEWQVLANFPAYFPRRSMPDTSQGTEGAERVNRTRTAPRFAAGPNTEFIDFFNADMDLAGSCYTNHVLYTFDFALACKK